jgi:chitodextrinase
MFNFSNNPSTPWTAAQARAVMFDNPDSIRAYFEEESFGQVAVTGEVYGWYTIPDTDAGCDYTGWASAARSGATAAGVSLSGYQHIVYAFPRTGSCGWAGLAYVRGRDSWTNGQMNLYVIGHELSHNLGVHHASSLRCTEGGVSVPLSSTCTVSEYGDPFSIMGQSGTRHSHNWHLGQMGWIAGAEVQTVTAPGRYWLGPADFADSGVKAIRVPRGSQYLYLELRRPYGTYFDNFSPSDPAVNGVTVRLAPDFPTVTQSRLVDANPSTATFADAPLAPGQVLSDPQYGITIVTQSVSSTGAVVQVSFGADTTPPTAPADLTARATSGSSVSLTWSPSSDDQAVAGYRVWRDGAVVGTTASTGYTDSGLVPETTYTYSVQAYDAAGNWSPPATATATTPAGDRTAPTAPTGLSGRRIKGGRVALAWGPSTDDVGVAGYRVYRNDALVATVTATGYTDRPPRRVTATYYVVAFDAAGNVSARSNSVTL